MKSLLFTTLLIIAAIQAVNTVHAQTTKLPDDVRRALPAAPSAESKPVAALAPAASKLDAESGSADELLKQALLRYQNIALQSDGLTEQFLKELNERIARLESKLVTTQGSPQKQPVAAKLSGSGQPDSQPPTHIALRPTSPQPTSPVTGPELVMPPAQTPVEVSAMPLGDAPGITVPKARPIAVAPGSPVPATSARKLDGIADVFDAAANNYERLAECFRQYADHLRKQIPANKTDPHK
jgi:hypothetical protein